jgi:hypothetical protein
MSKLFLGLTSVASALIITASLVMIAMLFRVGFLLQL